MSRLATLAAWADTRLAMRMDADALGRRRDRLWAAMRPVLELTPALRRHAGAALRDIEPIDPSAMRSDVAAWNSAGIGRDEALAAAHDAERGGGGIVRCGVSAGLSTGTGGARGLFLASPGERARYVGQSVAKLLPLHAPLTGARIALVLRADSQLYRDSGRGRFAFEHLPLGMDAAGMHAAITRFAPTVLIAPPRELAALAAAGRSLPATVGRILWGSEPMAPAERAAIAGALGLRPDPVYQATEGFIGAACPLGTLHLNDDSMDVELEPVPGTAAFRPIVTDLRRHVQPMVRVRMDDLVRPAACACGSACRAVEPVLGRVGDAWRVKGAVVTPEAVDDRIAGALPPFARWRANGSEDLVTVETTDAAHEGAVRRAIAGIHPDAAVEVRPVPDIGGAKRRRVTWEGRRP